MKFGWCGFEFDHDEDFAPATLGGTHSKGYVRLQSGPSRVIQVRWMPGKVVPTPNSLQTYFSRLRRDNRKNARFSLDWDVEGEGVRYRYDGQAKCEGVAFLSPESERTFLVEALATHRTGAHKDIRRVLDSFATDETCDRWALLGLDVTVPKGLRIAKTRLLSGRIAIDLAYKRTAITIERWALAQQILQKHDLGPWLQALTEIRGGVTEPEIGRVHLCGGGLFGEKRIALAKVDPFYNRIVFVSARYRDSKWQPQWDWFNN